MKLKCIILSFLFYNCVFAQDNNQVTINNCQRSVSVKNYREGYVVVPKPTAMLGKKEGVIYAELPKNKKYKLTINSNQITMSGYGATKTITHTVHDKIVVYIRKGQNLKIEIKNSQRVALNLLDCKFLDLSLTNKSICSALVVGSDSTSVSLINSQMFLEKSSFISVYVDADKSSFSAKDDKSSGLAIKAANGSTIQCKTTIPSADIDLITDATSTFIDNDSIK